MSETKINYLCPMCDGTGGYYKGKWTIIFQINGFYEYSYVEAPEPNEFSAETLIAGIKYPIYKAEVYERDGYEIICTLEGHQRVIFE